ncbi:MAG: hypothetical protein ABFS39_13925 [Pseudomonadota bacterium]
MKVSPIKLLVTLLTVSVWGYSAASFGSDSAAQQPEQSPAPAAVIEKEAVTNESPEPVGEGATALHSEAEQEMPAPVESAKTQTASTPEVTTTPIRGAFAIPLGEVFAPWMVAKIISQEESQYKGRGEEKTEYIGTLYTVEPHLPNQYFNGYSLKTNKAGVIYSIAAKQLPADKASACKKTKVIAAFLERKYGKPRGKGMLGEWYAFRESAAGPYKGIRLYAPRCRHGRYSVVYSDDAALMQEAAPKLEPEEMSGL